MLIIWERIIGLYIAIAKRWIELISHFSSSATELISRRGVFSRRHYGSVDQVVEFYSFFIKCYLFFIWKTGKAKTFLAIKICTILNTTFAHSPAAAVRVRRGGLQLSAISARKWGVGCRKRWGEYIKLNAHAGAFEMKPIYESYRCSDLLVHPFLRTQSTRHDGISNISWVNVSIQSNIVMPSLSLAWMMMGKRTVKWNDPPY